MPLTVGTAGHIDHGKTWLVRALTGKDTDRLPEERARGISIDLGYAPLELPDSVQVRLARLYKGARYLAPQRVALVPLPEVGHAVLGQAAARPADADLIRWVAELFDAILPSPPRGGEAGG